MSRRTFNPKSLVFWTLLPLNSFLGGYISNHYDVNAFSLFVLLIISVGGIWLLYNPKQHPYLGTFSIFISIMLINTASLTHVSGYGDVHFEYYYIKHTIQSGAWEPWHATNAKEALSSLNATLPIISLISGISVTLLYNYILPLIYALLGPLCLLIYRRVFADRNISVLAILVIAFGSPFLFRPVISGLSRQMLSTYSFLILVWAIFSRYQIGSHRYSIITSISIFSFVTSYYATSFLYMGFLAVAFLGSRLLKAVINSPLMESFPNKVGLSTSNKSLLPVTTVFLAGIFSFAYYWRTNSVFYDTLGILLGRLLSKLISIGESQTAEIASSAGSALPQTLLKLHYFIELGLICLGLLLTLVPLGIRKSIDPDYYSLAAGMVGLIGLTAVIPYLYFDTVRTFVLIIPISAPFLAIGIHSIGDIFDMRSALRTSISVFLVAGLLLNSGAVAEVLNASPSSPGLSQDSMQDESQFEQVYFYNHYNDFDQDVQIATFMREYTQFTKTGVYIDTLSSLPLMSYGMGGHDGWFVKGGIPLPTEEIKDGRYTILGYVNQRYGIFANINPDDNIIYERDRISGELSNENQIYSNGNGTVYY